MPGISARTKGIPVTDMTSFVKQPSLLSPQAPVYTQCTAADKFTPGAGAYMLHYKNAATPTGTVFLNEQKAPTPPAAAPAAPAGATKFSDAKLATSIGTSAELTVWLTASQIQNYIDVNGFVNLQHTTPTTLTLAIFGPLAD